MFAKRLRDGLRSGEITCSIRIWQRPRVTVGKEYSMPPGHIVVDSLMGIGLSDVTPELARRSGFMGVVDFLKVAKHGAGERVFFVEFQYVAET